MVVLDIVYEHKNVSSSITPFFCNGIFIDTSILRIYFEGFIKTRYEKKQDDQYVSLIKILNLLNLNNKWDKFFITPHILTEICRYIYMTYDKNENYQDIVNSIFPILSSLKEEKEITKEKILSLIDLKKPILKIGDISLFVSIDQFVDSSKKIAIFVKDKEFNERYELHPNVMLIDFQKTSLDLLNL